MLRPLVWSDELLKQASVGVYVHIPFCQKKCLYCDFNSYSGKDSLRAAYVEALCREMALAPASAAQAGEELRAATLYIGGGTPSLLAPGQLASVLTAARKHLGWDDTLETTIEANPGTIDLARARALRHLGINRLSLGFQSLDDRLLRRLGRIHRAKDALAAYAACRSAGFDNVNVDLMFALPGQSHEDWTDTLSRVIELAPEHLSLYPLAIEEGTPFSRLFAEGRLVAPDDDEAAAMYESAARMLASAGYEQYEISNWALGQNRFRCRHNVTYWLNHPYLGFGAGAHSWAGGRRYSNHLGPQEYIDRVGRGESPLNQAEDIGLDLEMKETVILGLRLVDGIGRREFAERFSRTLDQVFGSVIVQLAEDGLLLASHDRLALTSRGRLLANEAFVAVISVGEHSRR